MCVRERERGGREGGREGGRDRRRVKVAFNQDTPVWCEALVFTSIGALEDRCVEVQAREKSRRAAA